MSEETKEESQTGEGTSVDTTAGGAEDAVETKVESAEVAGPSSEKSQEAPADTETETKTLESARPPETKEAEGQVAAASGHGGHGHGEGHGHPQPMWMLLGVLGALIVLTVLTVAVTAIDLGAQGNLVVAMIIATVKAILVMGFFMHLFWDSRFNLIAFASSFLFVLLFLSMSVLDRSEYRPTVLEWEADSAAKK